MKSVFFHPEELFTCCECRASCNLENLHIISFIFPSQPYDKHGVLSSIQLETLKTVFWQKCLHALATFY